MVYSSPMNRSALSNGPTGTIILLFTEIDFLLELLKFDTGPNFKKPVSTKLYLAKHFFLNKKQDWQPNFSLLHIACY